MPCYGADLRMPAGSQRQRIRHLSHTQFATRTIGVPARVQSLDEPAHFSTLPCVRKQPPIASVVNGLLWSIHTSDVAANALLSVFDDQDRWIGDFVRSIRNARTHFVYGSIVTGLDK